MTDQFLAQNSCARKPLSVVHTDDTLSQKITRVHADGSRTPRCPTPHLTPDQYVRLLACIEGEGGIATLDGIARALPRVRQPISAVFDLCDVGILGADLESAFDGDMRVWRVDH